MINVKLGLLIQDCRKNVKFCNCVCFISGYKVQSGLIQTQFNPLILPDTIDYLLLKKRNVKKNFSFFTFNLTLSQTTNFRLFQTESLQTTISNLMKMEESSSTGLKTLLEKEKLLITSKFSFSHSVFKKACTADT